MLVASEELEPGAGWNYRPLLADLVARPDMSPVDLGRMVVSKYSDRYGAYHDTTLSLLDLSKVEPATEAISNLAEALMKGANRKLVHSARAPLRTFGAGDGLMTSVDVIAFAEALEAVAKDPLASSARVVKETARAMVDVSYASESDSIRATRAQGLAIYFPATRADYLSDTFRAGYRRDNRDHPVAFVLDNKWADFIAQWVH